MQPLSTRCSSTNAWAGERLTFRPMRQFRSQAHLQCSVHQRARWPCICPILEPNIFKDDWHRTRQGRPEHGYRQTLAGLIRGCCALPHPRPYRFNISSKAAPTRLPSTEVAGAAIHDEAGRRFGTAPHDGTLCVLEDWVIRGRMGSERPVEIHLAARASSIRATSINWVA